VGGVRGGSSSIVYRLGPAGLRLLAREGFIPRRIGEPGQQFLAHTLAVTELVVRLAEADRDGALELIRIKNEPACWRSFLSGYGARVMLKPDLYVAVGAGALEDRWWVEVDRATESLPVIAGKARRYLAYWRSGEEQTHRGTFPRVVWSVPDARRQQQITTALRRLGGVPEGLFVVWLFEEVVGRLAAEARS
jgi:hypothetical protein